MYSISFEHLNMVLLPYTDKLNTFIKNQDVKISELIKRDGDN